ncbi:MAG TPA: biotin carboxylase N-terminal domain-containing protein [Candidatus Binataceae bacterium]|nr:biotin carboxylase N-terminal domain-containing protein [Candidatus Binataceae bacterium]
MRKLLIANRGEIALRIIRSARALGIKTVAVYSDADASAAHVTAADEAVSIGESEPAKSYLNISAIITAAAHSGADAIHPGYGFLSERPEFARAVRDAGLIFVGPLAEVMGELGDKVAARRIAVRSGVPVVPGSDVADLATARDFGAKAGFPLMVKAAAGGGGRGMRVVEAAIDLAPALEAAAREAQAAFGDARLFIEKYLVRPRHIEVQLLGDSYGKTLALGERECSIQRRHQKIIEESPAPGLAPGLRDRIIGAAVDLARAAGYSNAGTVEFLVEGDDFYFLEVNARLQVEHPVTELRFGRDLVADQLLIAMGEHLGDPDPPRGAAIECRINAEDAMHDFRPATGRVINLALPSGPGVRVDTHLAEGAEISPYYDSLVAKLITYGANREEARRQMESALGEFALLGVRTTADFLHEVIASEPFARADLSTAFIPEFFAHWQRGDQNLKSALIAAAALTKGSAIFAADAKSGEMNANLRSRSPWRELDSFELWRPR